MDGVEIEFWYWWIAGVVFIAIEVFAPGAVFLWLAVSAGVVGALLLLFPDLTWQAQFLIFAALSVASVFGWLFYRKRMPQPESDEPALNRRGQQYVGRVFTLEQAIVNGQGKIKVDDTIWKIEGDDLPEGTKITVTGVEGTVLRVTPAEGT